ncbi:MAG: hypothetical protein LLG15_11175 [Betaproteobacteria bacterium]|nr:hypothetical protein [Betaproteobacteria bacterium]
MSNVSAFDVKICQNGAPLVFTALAQSSTAALLVALSHIVPGNSFGIMVKAKEVHHG